jgi:hypothetical protein
VVLEGEVTGPNRFNYTAASIARPKLIKRSPDGCRRCPLPSEHAAALRLIRACD